uniref:CreCAP-ShK6 n=1 Tax=Colubraria reticulata TaxID=604273 RepID=A0A481SMK6_9CAEN|nr:CreCAP-ShK6 [Colubraria reticulata]
MTKNVAGALMVMWVFAGLVSIHGGHGSVMDSNSGRMLSRGRRGVRRESKETCTGEFESIPGHTMCMTDNSRMTTWGVSSDERAQIVQQHNDARRDVTPSATDLTPLIWNDKLADVAQKWAKQCVFDHDTERSVPSLGLSVGQNVAVGQDSWQEAIQGWHDEVMLYTFGQDPNRYPGADGWKKIAHYTQMVQNTTYLVGCGLAFCQNDRYGRYYVCNYASGQTRLDFPYTKGSRCLACPNSCPNGLCECGRRVCLNGGTLNLRTCSCKCPSVYKGELCEEMNCPNEDPSFCSRSHQFSDCKRYSNLPHLCPYMCKLCKGETFTSPFGCEFTGRRATPDQCKTYGDRGRDSKQCAINGGSFGCSDCSQYDNVKQQYCPVQCGLCKAD